MCEELGNSGKDHQGHSCSQTIWTCCLAGRKSTDHEKPWKTQQHGVVKGFVAFVCGIHDLGEGVSKVLHSTLLLPGKEFRCLITQVL